MTRNPETTEAARTALLARLSRILGEVPVGTLDLLNVLTGPDCASYTAAILAVSPAVTEGERATIMIPRPSIAFDGRRPISGDLSEAAERVESMRLWGSNKTATIAKLLRDAAEACAAPSPAVTAAEDETWGREKPHTLTRYGTTNCPVEGVRANVDDGECSACGDPVVAAVPAEEEK